MSEQINGSSAVVHPNHYNVYDLEVIDMMAKLWGNEAVVIWCKLNAYKYRMRMGYKNCEDPVRDFKAILQDFQKEQECLALMREYKARMEKEGHSECSESIEYPDYDTLSFKVENEKRVTVYPRIN